MDSKYIKILVSFSLILSLLYLGYKYLRYQDEINNLERLYNNPGIIADIDSYLSSRFEITGELPSKQEVLEFLPKVDSVLFFAEQYSLKIDESQNTMLLYSFHPSKKDNHLRNKIDARLYINKANNYKQGFSFLSYLFNDKYNILLFEGAFEYNCNNRGLHNAKFLSKDDILIWDDKKINKKLNLLLNKIGLELGFKRDFSKSTIYIYDGKQLKNMCPEKPLLINKEIKESLLRSLKTNFSKYDYIKFSITLKKLS